MTDIKIYQGNQIGGCITVISTDSSKIIIDFGESLPGAGPVENIDFDWVNEKVDVVFFTHYHGDHIGRFMEIPENVPLYMGEVTWKVLINFYGAIRKPEYVDRLKNIKSIKENINNINFIEITKPIIIGDIKVTPYSVDHSAYDAYMFLVETPDKNILHTGDYRDHGHRGHKIKNGKDQNVMLDVIKYYVKDHGKRKIDTLITEGTMLGSRKNEKYYSEKQMLVDATEFFKDYKYIFLKISSTNVDSLASFYKAAEKNGMGFYGSQYIMSQLHVYREAGKKYRTNMYDFKNTWPIMPNPNKEGLSKAQVHSSTGQRKHMREEGFVLLVSENEAYEEIMAEFEDLNPVLIYSMWRGYIDKEIGGQAYNPKLAAFCNKYNAKIMHTGGHASPEFIGKVIEAAQAKKVITIHTEGE